MSNTQNISDLSLKFKYFYFGSIILLTLGCVFSFIFEFYILSIFIFLFPIFIFCAYKFEKYFTFFFLSSLFIGGYYLWAFRIQICLLLAFYLIFFFITNKESSLFNNFKLPNTVKYSGTAIIAAVYLSAILTPYFSFFTIYYATIFLIFVSTSYIIFRSVKNVEEIDTLLLYFVIMTFIAGITVVCQILFTGKLRSMGIANYPIMDFSAMALVTILFRNFLLSKIENKSTIFSILILVVLITTQSRFAWLGFILTLIYGIIICYVKSKESKVILKKRAPVFVLTVLIGISLFYAIGLESIFSQRISDISFSFFQNSNIAEGEILTNSLESRILIWIIAFNTFLHHPFTGVGYFMFNETSINYNILPDFLFNLFVKDLDAHTTLMNFLCETGIIGLFCFIIYLITIFKYSLKSIKLSRTSQELKVSIILNILIFFIMVHSIYSGAFTLGQNAFHMHIIFGLTIANYVILKNKINYVEKSNK
jgi:O-antigen ligase